MESTKKRSRKHLCRLFHGQKSSSGLNIPKFCLMFQELSNFCLIKMIILIYSVKSIAKKESKKRLSAITYRWTDLSF